MKAEKPYGADSEQAQEAPLPSRPKERHSTLACVITEAIVDLHSGDAVS